MWFTYTSNYANWIVLKVDAVKEMIEINKEGKKVTSLEDYVEENTIKDKSFENAVGEDNLSRFDQPKKKKKITKKRKIVTTETEAATTTEIKPKLENRNKQTNRNKNENKPKQEPRAPKNTEVVNAGIQVQANPNQKNKQKTENREPVNKSENNTNTSDSNANQNNKPKPKKPFRPKKNDNQEPK